MRQAVAGLALTGLVGGCGLLGDQVIARDANLPSPAETVGEVRRLLPPVVEQIRTAGFTAKPVSGRYVRCAGSVNDEPGKHAIGWRYEADAELGGTVYELPEQLGPGLERHGWTVQPTDCGDELEARHGLALIRLSVDHFEVVGPCVPVSKREDDAYRDERAVVDPDAIGSSSYDKDPDLPAADAQRATALEEVRPVLEELRSVGPTPRFATGEYHECGGNKGLWPVDGAKWSYVVSMRLDPPRGFVETRQLTGVRAGLDRLGWNVSGAANNVVAQARKGGLTLEVTSKYGGWFGSVAGPCASVSQRQHIEFGMAYRDDYVAGGRP